MKVTNITGETTTNYYLDIPPKGYILIDPDDSQLVRVASHERFNSPPIKVLGKVVAELKDSSLMTLIVRSLSPNSNRIVKY